MDATYTPVEAIYQDSKDKRVSNYVLYSDGTDLFLQAAHSTRPTVEEAYNACLHGCLVHDATAGYSTVTSFKMDGGSLTVKVGDTTFTVAAAA